MPYKITNISDSLIILENGEELYKGEDATLSTLSKYLAKLHKEKELKVRYVSKEWEYTNLSNFESKLLKLKLLVEDQEHRIKFIGE